MKGGRQVVQCLEAVLVEVTGVARSSQPATAVWCGQRCNISLQGKKGADRP